MTKMMFWIGVAVLVVGIILFGYACMTIQNIKDVTTPLTISVYFNMYPDAKQQWDLAQMLQPIGLGLLALGAIMLAYGVFVKK